MSARFTSLPPLRSRDQATLAALALAKLVTYTIVNNRVSLDPVNPYLCSLSWQHHASQILGKILKHVPKRNVLTWDCLTLVVHPRMRSPLALSGYVNAAKAYEQGCLRHFLMSHKTCSCATVPVVCSLSDANRISPPGQLHLVLRQFLT